MDRTIDNAKRDGIRITRVPAGSTSAGRIRSTAGSATLSVIGRGKEPTRVEVPLRYEMEINRDHSDGVQYATLCHELAHLYCGQLGPPDAK